MQLCLVVAVFVSWLSVDFAPAGRAEWAAWKLSAVMMCHLVVVLAAWAMTRMTLAESNSQLYPADLVARRFLGRQRWHHALWICLLICSLACFDLARVVTQLFESLSATAGWPGLATMPLMLRVCVTLPMLVSLVLSWSFSFDVEQRLDPELTAASRLGHVLTLFRSTLLVPLMAAVVVSGWIESVNYFWPRLVESNWSTVIHSMPLAFLALALPTLLVRLWKTSSLPEGALRRRLERQTAEAGVSVRDIVVWDTGDRFCNAAVAGFAPATRYLLLTDRLLRELSSDEIELVVMHEMAHVKHGHNGKMLLAVVGSLTAVCALLGAAGDLNSGSQLTLAVAIALGVPVIAGMSAWLICRYARLLEFQADLWAAKKSGDAVAYLRVIGAMSGGEPDATDWLHPSFSHRCTFLANGTVSAAALIRSQLQLSSLALFGWIGGSLLLAAILVTH